MDFSGKHVVVTGGTGALGTSVVSALIGAGELYSALRSDGKPSDFPTATGRKRH
jgi:NAD(P)-dependent dehydrogenase (short-subunit alcohol dehydrogenase family)